MGHKDELRDSWLYPLDDLGSAIGHSNPQVPRPLGDGPSFEPRMGASGAPGGPREFPGRAELRLLVIVGQAGRGDEEGTDACRKPIAPSIAKYMKTKSSSNANSPPSSSLMPAPMKKSVVQASVVASSHVSVKIAVRSIRRTCSDTRRASMDGGEGDRFGPPSRIGAMGEEGVDQSVIHLS